MKITETSSNRPKRLKTSITELDAFISIATGPRFFFFKSLARNFQLVLFTRREETTSASRWVELEKFFALIAPLPVIISDMRDGIGGSFKSCAFFFFYCETLKLSRSWKHGNANEQNIFLYNIVAQRIYNG